MKKVDALNTDRHVQAQHGRSQDRRLDKSAESMRARSLHQGSSDRGFSFKKNAQAEKNRRDLRAGAKVKKSNMNREHGFKQNKLYSPQRLTHERQQRTAKFAQSAAQRNKPMPQKASMNQYRKQQAQGQEKQQSKGQDQQQQKQQQGQQKEQQKTQQQAPRSQGQAR